MASPSAAAFPGGTRIPASPTTSGSAPPVVLITGTVPQEGKTTTAVSLGRLLAAAGESTVVVDCDLRRGLHAKRWFDAVGHYEVPYFTRKLGAEAPEAQGLDTEAV